MAQNVLTQSDNVLETLKFMLSNQIQNLIGIGEKQAQVIQGLQDIKQLSDKIEIQEVPSINDIEKTYSDVQYLQAQTNSQTKQLELLSNKLDNRIKKEIDQINLMLNNALKE